MLSPCPPVRTVLRAHALNGERPGWDAARGILYFVDMRAPALHAFVPATGQHRWWDMPAWIGTYGILEDGRLAVALRTGLHLFDPEAGSLRFLAPAPYDPRRFCFNDGRCDRRGRLIVGAMFHALGPAGSRPDEPQTQPIWRFDGRTTMEPLPLAPAKIANGIAFSPDGRVLYHSDTAAKTIWACDYDPEAGAIGERRVFARVEEGGEIGGPDGAVIDRDGYYLCAVFGAGCLLRFDPEGVLERRIPLPVRYPTMPAIGGAELDTLYVTSASYPVTDPRDDPDAGSLLALQAPAPGLPTSYMTITEELDQ